MDNNLSWSEMALPVYTAKLIIEDLHTYHTKIPNYWNRLWQRVFLGWRWEKI